MKKMKQIMSQWSLIHKPKWACYEIGQHSGKKYFLEECYFLLFGSFY